MAAIKFPCPNCNKLMAVSEEFAGKRVRCPHCQQVIVAGAANLAADAGGAGDPFNFAGPGMPPARNFGVATESDALASAPAESDSPFAPSPNAYKSVRQSLEGESQDDAPRAVRGNSAAASGKSNWLLGILAPYAVFMTVMAIWYYMKYQNAVRDHPLEMIPDLLGEYQKEIKKDGKPVVRAIKLPSADLALPDRLITSLGKPIRVGDIELTPLSIEYRTLDYFKKLKNREEPLKEPFTSLVMRVRLRNTSPNLAFYPTDPYFDRHPKTSSEKPYTLVDIAGQKTFGGVLPYDIEPGHTQRIWLEGQENDNKPLGPGEARETIFVTQPKAFEALQKAKEPAVWRIQVRRGLVPFHDQEIPVSAVVGVSFTAADVRKSG